MKKKCPVCNADVREGVKYCSGCGSDLRSWEERQGVMSLSDEKKSQIKEEELYRAGVRTEIAKPNTGLNRKLTKKQGCLTIIGGFIVFIGLISMLGSNKTATTNTAVTNTTPTTAVVTPRVVNATALVGEFDKNKLSADDKYKGKVVQTTGFIGNISSEITGDPYLSLKPTNDQYYFGTNIVCYFKKEDKNQLMSLANGQSVTIQGVMQEMSLGMVVMQDCKVVE